MKKTLKSKFCDQTRFGWGYHDAVQSVQEGWDNSNKNYGFGPAIKITCPNDVLVYHDDLVYAEGWIRGYYAAKDKQDTMDSERAWFEHAGQ